MEAQVRTGVCKTEKKGQPDQYFDFLDIVLQPKEQHEVDAVHRAEWLGRKEWPILYRDGMERVVIRFRNEVK